MNQLIPSSSEWDLLKAQAKALVESEFLPKAVNTPQKAVTIIMMARELGIGPMEGLSKISVIQGKPTMGAELMKAMVHKKMPKAIIRIAKSDDNECVIEAARPGEEIAKFQYTMADAKRMNLAHKDNWIKQPKVMLKWRCISDVCRTVFPDCLSGISHTPEELNPDLSIDENGEIIEIEAKAKAPLIEAPAPVVIEPAELPIEVAINEAETKDEKQKHRKRMYALMKEKGWTKEQVQTVMNKAFGTDKTTLLKAEDFKALLAVLEYQTYEEAMEDLT